MDAGIKTLLLGLLLIGLIPFCVAFLKAGKWLIKYGDEKDDKHLKKVRKWAIVVCILMTYCIIVSAIVPLVVSFSIN
jgi:membrane protein required for beta-lactamase induction